MIFMPTKSCTVKPHDKVYKLPETDMAPEKMGGLGLFPLAFTFRFREGHVILPPKPPPAWSRPGI